MPGTSPAQTLPSQTGQTLQKPFHLFSGLISDFLHDHFSFTTKYTLYIGCKWVVIVYSLKTFPGL